MIAPFLRLIVNIPVGHEGVPGVPVTVAGGPVQAVLEVLWGCLSAGRVGTYRNVAEILCGEETYVPTAASAPAHGIAGISAVVPAARVITFLPANMPAADLQELLTQVAAAHPWEHPVIEIDQISLWLPDDEGAGVSPAAPA